MIGDLQLWPRPATMLLPVLSLLGAIHCTRTGRTRTGRTWIRADWLWALLGVEDLWGLPGLGQPVTDICQTQGEVGWNMWLPGICAKWHGFLQQPNEMFLQHGLVFMVRGPVPVWQHTGIYRKQVNCIIQESRR